MKYLQLNRNTKLTELASYVGNRNIDTVLHLNGLSRTPYIGQELISSQGKTVVESPDVDWQRKATLLNSLANDYDLFEYASTMGEAGWKLYSNRYQFPNMIKVPDDITVPDTSIVWGNGKKVPNKIYNTAQIHIASEETGHSIDPSIFNEYSYSTPTGITSSDSLPKGSSSASHNNFFTQWFKIPWGEVTLYTDLNQNANNTNLVHDHEDFPVYPEEVSDSVTANYSTMPDLIYQYEPWQLYTGSGPRTNSYTFSFHRDMWTGDHRDGMANRLIRFCQANCYPRYKGSSVQVPTVTLYVSGYNLITGVLTDVKVDWSGPLGLDSWYLECKLELTITEVSPIELNFDSVRKKPLIG